MLRSGDEDVVDDENDDIVLENANNNDINVGRHVYLNAGREVRDRLANLLVNNLE